MNMAFKITYGYGPTDFVIVESLDDVARAIYAKTEKISVTLKGKFISGNEIKSIEPDIHTYTGWNRSYTPSTHDDFQQIERDVPKNLYTLIDKTSERVKTLIQNNQLELIGKEDLDQKYLN